MLEYPYTYFMNDENLRGEEVANSLSLTSKKGVYEITKQNGSKYSVRTDRRRYFFPQEWNKFINSIKNEKHYILFLTLLHTGARIMEALHLKPKNFNFERGTITFEVVKQRKAKKKFFAIGKNRTFFVSDVYLNEIKSYARKNKIEDDKYIFLDNSQLPPNYDSLDNKEKKKYYAKTCVAYAQMLKRKLKSVGIEDWRNFSLHNIRKTYGNWMRLYDIRMEELCYRLGHDTETFMVHYGSSLIFTPQERMGIMKIMGNVK